jgi:hypothetical protein
MAEEKTKETKASTGMGYVFTSSYFIVNLIAVLSYPVARVAGLKQKGQSQTD